MKCYILLPNTLSRQASPRLYASGKIRLGKLTLGKLINGNLTMGKLTWVYLPRINSPNVFYPGRLSRVTLPG